MLLSLVLLCEYHIGERLLKKKKKKKKKKKTSKLNSHGNLRYKRQKNYNSLSQVY